MCFYTFARGTTHTPQLINLSYIKNLKHSRMFLIFQLTRYYEEIFILLWTERNETVFLRNTRTMNINVHIYLVD